MVYFDAEQMQEFWRACIRSKSMKPWRMAVEDAGITHDPNMDIRVDFDNYGNCSVQNRQPVRKSEQ